MLLGFLSLVSCRPRDGVAPGSIRGAGCWQRSRFDAAPNTTGTIIAPRGTLVNENHNVILKIIGMIRETQFPSEHDS